MSTHRAEWLAKDPVFAVRLAEMPMTTGGAAGLEALDRELSESVRALRKARGDDVARLQGYCDGLERLKHLVSQGREVAEKSNP